jgi:transposase
MGKQGSKYSEEFKREALRQLESGRPTEQVALDLGVGKTTLWRWRLELKDGKSLETVGDSDVKKENARLRRRVRELEEDREILKKAAAFFAKEKP